jgi:radical SAM superfamily enzyme YgiQ (UPF0313 family)
MARVLWVRPPLRGLFPTTNTGGQARNFPVGLAYLNAVAKRAGHESEILDCLTFVEDSHVIDGSFISPFEEEKIRRFPRPNKKLFHVGATWERIADLVRDARPDVVGISCMFSSYHLSAGKVGEIVKAVSPETLVVLGGQHATSLPKSALAHAAIDCIVLGEAEALVEDLLANAAERRILGDLPALGYRCGTGFCTCTFRRAEPHLNPRAPWNDALDALPFPDSGDLDWTNYDNTGVLITSRGCPLACTFCSVHDMVGKQFRSRSAENVADEVEFFMRAHGIRRFNIEDDNFTWDIDRVRQICRTIRDRKLGAEFWLPNGITAIKLADDVVGDMIDAGFAGLFIGLETTDQATLRKIKKGFTSLETVSSRLMSFRSKVDDITANASLIIGLPGQTVRDFAIDVVRLRRRDITFWANPYYAVPGSPDREKLILSGKLDPAEDACLTEPWSFHRTFEIDSEGLYWAQLAAYAVRRPDVFSWFVESLAASSVDHARARRFAELLAARSGGGVEYYTDFTFGLSIEVVNDMQHEPYSVWQTPKLQTVGHGIAADFLSMCVSLAIGASLRVDEARCANAGGSAARCMFRFSSDELPASAEKVRAAFVEAALQENGSSA